MIEACLLRDLLCANQCLVQSRAFTTGEYRCRQAKCGDIGTGCLWSAVDDGRCRERDDRSVLLKSTLGGPLGFNFRYASDRAGRLRQTSEIFIDPRVELLLLEVSNNNQHGVIRPVIFLVKLFCIGTRCRRELVEIADHATTIRVLLKSDVVEQPIQAAVRGIENTLSILLLD